MLRYLFIEEKSGDDLAMVDGLGRWCAYQNGFCTGRGLVRKAVELEFV